MGNLISSETRLFSQYNEDKGWNVALRKSSRSIDDAKLRKDVYSKVFARFEENKEQLKKFSGYAEIPLLSNQYFNATMASFVRSYAGFLSIERDMDQPTALLWYMDLLGVTDNRIVLPNVGPDNLNGINGRFTTSSAFAGQAMVQISSNKKLIPGSVEITFIHAADPTTLIKIRDDRNGNLIAPAGILAPTPGIVGVNYQTGLITFEPGDGFTVAAGDSYSLIGYEDVAGTPEFGTLTGPGNNRFKTDMKNIVVTSEPDMLVAENNLMAIASMQKAIGANPQDVSGAKLVELYTKLINQKMVGAIQSSSTGNSYVIDMTGYIGQFHDYRSRLDAFQADLVNVDTNLAKKSYKGCQATAYVCGETTANWFRKLRATGEFTDNTDSTYINDLIGYYKGIPVLRHTDIAANSGYAIHKTADGQLAPLMRGIFLPLTNTPLIGNYNNPSQFAQGIYYQESNSPIVPELIQKFEVNA